MGAAAHEWNGSKEYGAAERLRKRSPEILEHWTAKVKAGTGNRPRLEGQAAALLEKAIEALTPGAYPRIALSGSGMSLPATSETLTEIDLLIRSVYQMTGGDVKFSEQESNLIHEVFSDAARGASSNSLRSLRGTNKFGSLFSNCPGLYLILSPDLEIVTASEAYLKATLTRLDEIAGKNIFAVFLGNLKEAETGPRNLKESLETVLRTKEPDSMPIQKYSIQRPVEKCSDFEVRYWSPINLPVVNEKDEVEYIIHRVEDVTDFVTEEQKTKIGKSA